MPLVARRSRTGCSLALRLFSWGGALLASGVGVTTVGQQPAAAQGPPVTIIALPTSNPQTEWYGTNGYPLPLQALVLDADDNPVSGVVVTFTAPSSGPTASFGSSLTEVTNAQGIASTPAFDQISAAGTYEVTASAPGAGSAVFVLSGTSTAPDSVSASPTSSPQTTVTGSNLAQPLVALVTNMSQPVPGVTVTFTAYPGWSSGGGLAGPSSGTFSGSTTATAVTNAEGQAVAPTFTANGSVGSYVVTATAASAYQPAVFDLTNSSAEPDTIVPVPNTTPQNEWFGTNGYPQPLEALVVNAFGVPVSGTTVTFSAPATGPGASFGTSITETTNAQGIATTPAFDQTSGTGVYMVTATAADTISPAVFTLGGSGTTPDSIAPEADTGGQSVALDSTPPLPLTAVVTQNGQPVSGVAVTFTSFVGEASGVGFSGLAYGTFSGSATATVITNALGQAQAPGLTTNDAPGTFMVTATTPGGYQPAVFRLRNGGGSPGYWLVDASGNVHPFGTELALGGVSGLTAPAVAMASTPDGGGYWVADSAGNVAATGDAAVYALPQPPDGLVVAMAATPDGRGYWLATAAGQVLAAGDAQSFGSPRASRLHLTAPIVAMAATPTGHGYWLVGSDGGVFAYGDARFLGSEGRIRLNAPIVSMAATPDGGGYWLAGSDGGIFTFGDAVYHGSTYQLNPNRPAGGHNSVAPIAAPIVGLLAGPDGDGYWMVAADGGVFTFGDAAFAGSLAGQSLTAPVVSGAR